MLSTPQSDRNKDDGSIPVETLSVLIARQVVKSLGSPKEMLKVKVHPVGNDRYRVNVLVGKDITTARIADSFFLTADEKGNIVDSSPKIVRLY